LSVATAAFSVRFGAREKDNPHGGGGQIAQLALNETPSEPKMEEKSLKPVFYRGFRSWAPEAEAGPSRYAILGPL